MNDSFSPPVEEDGQSSLSTQLLTLGNWSDEKNSAEAFDEILEKFNLFQVYKEIRGCFLQPRARQEAKTLRIDRILVPKQKLAEIGWKEGIIGVDLKRSGQKAGPALAQIMDYSRAVWFLPAGYQVVLNWVFLWPLGKTYELAASICEQQAIGSCFEPYQGDIGFYCGQRKILFASHKYGIQVGQALLNGKRSGAR